MIFAFSIRKVPELAITLAAALSSPEAAAIRSVSFVGIVMDVELAMDCKILRVGGLLLLSLLLIDLLRFGYNTDLRWEGRVTVRDNTDRRWEGRVTVRVRLRFARLWDG